MEPVNLTVADLASICNLLEAAINRGTYKANEITAVGTLYDKLSAFVTAAQTQVDQTQPQDNGTLDTQAQGDENA